MSVLPAQTSTAVEDLVNINFTADIRVFAVMAALNAAGFDYETAGKEMSEVRRHIRQEVQKTDQSLLEQLRTFYRGHSSGADELDQQVAYTSLALLLSEPPDFQVVVKEEEMPEDARQVLGFEQLVREFYQEANIEPLWQIQQPAYEREIASYRSVIKDLIGQTLDYFRIPPRVVLDRQIILIPDLLNAKTIVNARNLEHVYYIVVGPTDKAAENYRQLQHEYLHSLIDPLIEKFGIILVEHGDLLELAQIQPQLKTQFRNKYFLLVAESLIESVLLRLHHPEEINRELVKLFRQGFIFAPYFYRELKRYEEETELISFPSYVETVFKGVEKSLIQEDAKTIAAFESEIKSQQEQEATAQEKALQEISRRNRITTLLNQAGLLLSEKQFQSAGESLQAVLREDPDNGNAYFYLAQIASQTNQYQQAFEYYTQAAGAPGIPNWVRAWSLLRIGNYHAFQGQFGEARSYFDLVLEMEGDLRGAREKVQRSLEQLP
ncbi:tetratricopeptide repeat protein [Acidobacteria bacterium AH-259-D05]|nr:tetratricopeptide repeat protein [Acidobacteria bacterium AH-259-D05]